MCLLCVATVPEKRFTFSQLSQFDSHGTKIWSYSTRQMLLNSQLRDRQLWGCIHTPPFNQRRPHLRYPWQDLGRELSANFGSFRCFPFRAASTRLRCCIAGPDVTTAVTSRIHTPIAINVIVVPMVVKQTYCGVLNYNCANPLLLAVLQARSYVHSQRMNSSNANSTGQSVMWLWTVVLVPL
jgi:hypothetical protein